MRPRVEWEVRRVSSATKARSSRSTDAAEVIAVGRVGRDDPQLGLGLGQGDEDVEPGLEPASFLEDGPQLLGPPEVGVLLGVGYAGAHAGSAVAATRCSPSRTRSSEAPHGTVTVAPSRSMCSSSRQHLVSSGLAPPARAASPPRAEVDRLRLLAVEPAVELAGAVAAEQRPALLLGPLVEEPHLGPVQLDARSPAGQEVPWRPALPGQLGQVDHVRHQLDGGEVLGHLEHPPGLVEELRRLRRHDLAHPDPDGGGVEDEAHVPVPPLHDHAAGRRGQLPRRASELGGHAGVDLGRVHQRALARQGQDVDADDRREQRPVVGPGDLDHGGVGTAASHDVAGAAVGLAAEEVPLQALGGQVAGDAGHRHLPVAAGNEVPHGPDPIIAGPPTGQSDRVGPQAEPQRLQAEHLGGGHVAEADVGAEAPDEPGLLVLVGRLEDDRLLADAADHRLDDVLADRAVGPVQADRAALAALGHRPGGAGLQVAGHLRRPGGGGHRDGRVLRADLGQDREATSRLRDQPALVGDRHADRAVGHLDAREAQLAGPVEAGRGLPLGPRDLQERAADTGQDVMGGQHGDLLADPGVDVGGAPAELPHVDVPADQLQRRLQLGQGEALVEHVGQPRPSRLDAPRRKVEEAAVSHHFV